MARITKNPQERRNDIIDTALDLFLEKEYEKTSLQDVMNVLGIAKGTIYHYFKSKEELLQAVIEKMSKEFQQSLEKKLIKSKKSNAIKRLQAFLKACDISKTQKKLCEQLHQPGNIRLHTKLLALTINKVSPVLADIIRQGCDEGVFNTNYPTETAEILLAGAQFITDTGFYSWQKSDLKRRNKALPFLIEYQLSAKPGSILK